MSGNLSLIIAGMAEILENLSSEYDETSAFSFGELIGMIITQHECAEDATGIRN
jgi:hypothetical protein